MKGKIYIVALSALLITGCSDDSSSSGYFGYIIPGDFVAKATTPTAYNLGGLGETCATAGNDHCSAVIFNTYVYSSYYAGFGARDSHLSAANPRFNLKVYWPEVPLPTGTGLSRTVIATIQRGTSYYSTYTTINIDIVDNGDGTDTITFNNPLVIGAVTINAGSTIRARRY